MQRTGTEHPARPQILLNEPAKGLARADRQRRQTCAVNDGICGLASRTLKASRFREHRAEAIRYRKLQTTQPRGKGNRRDAAGAAEQPHPTLPAGFTTNPG